MSIKDVNTIIFDVDGTLSEEVSWLKITEGFGASVDEHANIFARMLAGELSYPDAKHLLITLWQKTGKANKKFMHSLFKSWYLKHDAHETISDLKNKYRLCLMSGSVDLYVQTVAEKLGIEDWYANTELVWDKKEELIDFHYRVDQAVKKTEQLQEYIAKNNLDIKKCAVVGDGDSDIGLFQKLPYGIVVYKGHHPVLDKLAYKTVKNLSELKEIF